MKQNDNINVYKNFMSHIFQIIFLFSALWYIYFNLACQIMIDVMKSVIQNTYKSTSIHNTDWVKDVPRSKIDWVKMSQGLSLQMGYYFILYSCLPSHTLRCLSKYNFSILNADRIRSFQGPCLRGNNMGMDQKLYKWESSLGFKRMITLPDGSVI